MYMYNETLFIGDNYMYMYITKRDIIKAPTYIIYMYHHLVRGEN